MIGDRREDMEAGLKNGKKAIFAAYGYGSSSEGDGAYKKISSIKELDDIL